MMLSPEQLRPPSGLDRREKYEFRRVIAARQALGRPVQAAEINTVADYVQARSRIAMLSALAERERTQGFSRDYLTATRAVETATATSRRLAQDLGLVLGADA